MKRTKAFLIVTFVVTILLAAGLAGAQSVPPVAVDDVRWDSLGKDENTSMPLGNGDMAVNVWTGQNGDIVLLMAKGDAWSENGQLLKLGRVRISLTPNPFVGAVGFTQTLRLEDASIELRAGKNLVRIWVDANHPVIRVGVSTAKAVSCRAVAEIWRNRRYHFDQHAVNQAEFGFWESKSNPAGLDFYPDTILAVDHGLGWCHYDPTSLYPTVFTREHLGSLLSKYPDPILHRCFGVIAQGKDLVRRDDTTLVSGKPAKAQELSFYALTEQTESVRSWTADLRRKIKTVSSVKIADAWKAHEQWWKSFWDRSWIDVSGTPDAQKVSEGYAMQRYMTACAGRSRYPIKHNGSLFTVGHDMPPGVVSNQADHDPDYRRWGGSYWNQNSRHIYWPLIASGDYDMLKPWFDMYLNALPLARDRTRMYYHHDGADFIETILFWGLPNLTDYGWNNQRPDPQSSFMRYHIQGGLEVTAQMLDYYDNTQDSIFLRTKLLPFADAIITYYAGHYQRGQDGKMVISPAQSIEMYQLVAVDPTPDIAGLRSVLGRLQALPAGLTSRAERESWTATAHAVPDIPIGTTANGKLPPNGIGDPDGRKTILPAKSYGRRGNIENPELYSVFPYRVYAVGKPDLELARNTFDARLFPLGKCWGQDGMEAALLGLTDTAKASVVESFTSYGPQRFKWFWSENNDWIPDMDNGGAMTSLQLMLMQTEGRVIRLLPAWPGDWSADFKLHAPYNTTVEGHVEDGKLVHLKVIPAQRTKDVIIGQ